MEEHDHICSLNILRTKPDGEYSAELFFASGKKRRAGFRTIEGLMAAVGEALRDDLHSRKTLTNLEPVRDAGE